MNPLVLVVAAVGVIALTAVVVAGLALFHTRNSAAAPKQDPGEHTRLDAEVRELRSNLEAFSAEIRHLQQERTVHEGRVPRAGLNLNKRSQAIRMHRRGESAEAIAAALDLPRREVDLLLKVHRIVIRSIET